MLRVSDIRLPVLYSKEELNKKIAGALRCRPGDIAGVQLVKRSLDARKKPELKFVITADVNLSGGKKANERALAKSAKGSKGPCVEEAPEPYVFPFSGLRNNGMRPVIVGAGPAGMMCAYHLARAGLAPLLIERGKRASERAKDVNAFWENGTLNRDSNVQFGEGGAGTFSDGKLNTLIKDKGGRCRSILRLYADMGAGEDILYDAKPHVGSDRLIGMCENLRRAVIEAGGEVLFETLMTGIETEDGRVTGVRVRSLSQGSDENGSAEKIKDAGISGERIIRTDTVVLAIGHSARDTFRMLHDMGVRMEAKAFAAGYRVIHPQKMIDESQYGMQPDEVYEKLGAASYKLTAAAQSGRGVYTFCMCPGGYVVNASSEEGRLAVNGMSYSGRSSGYANSAVIVSVTPDDFQGGGSDPLSGIRFQEMMERKAFELGNGAVVVQHFGQMEKRLKEKESHEENKTASFFGESGAARLPIKGKWTFADAGSILPDNMVKDFIEGMHSFGRRIKGFDDPAVLICGIESRTSSPVRIPRNETGQSELKGLYPVGEGAGYAGGIMSAALDGLLTAEKIAEKYSAG